MMHHPTTLRHTLLVCLCGAASLLPAAGQAQPRYGAPSQALYVTTTEQANVPYRIPAISQTPSGRIVTVCDYRLCGSDIGYGRVDLVTRYSDDNGRTWSGERLIVAGTAVPDNWDCGFGDPALVADRESEALMLLCVCGNNKYGSGLTTRQNPQYVARMYSRDGGQTWSQPFDLTEQFYGAFDRGTPGPVSAMFVGSGRLCQSALIKAGSHYRIYAPVCARPNGNRVLYTDDFGKTWHALGGASATPVPQGDEPKCMELPNGDVLISSRAWGGRLYNIYHYTDRATGEGEWMQCAFSSPQNGGVEAKDNACNGGVLLVPAKRKSDGRRVQLLLQSVPLGPKRANVGIHYKEILSDADLATPQAIAQNWTGTYQATDYPSAYSEMLWLRNHTVAFIFEETTHPQADYSLIYQPLTIETITAGKYTYAKPTRHSPGL